MNFWELWIVPCTDGSYDFVMGHDIIGSASSFDRAVKMACGRCFGLGIIII